MLVRACCRCDGGALTAAPETSRRRMTPLQARPTTNHGVAGQRASLASRVPQVEKVFLSCGPGGRRWHERNAPQVSTRTLDYDERLGPRPSSGRTQRPRPTAPARCSSCRLRSELGSAKRFRLHYGDPSGTAALGCPTGKGWSNLPGFKVATRFV